jgi:hypothetical protein
MNLRDPRVQKTNQLLMVTIFSLWIGEFSGQENRSTLGWVAFAIFTAALAISLFILLRDIWKPNA